MKKTNVRLANLIIKTCTLSVLTLCISILPSLNANAAITLNNEKCVYSHTESGFSMVIPDDYYYLTNLEWRGYDELYSEKELKEMADRNLRDKIELEMYDEEFNTHYTVLFTDKGAPTDISDKTVQDDLISSMKQRLPENLRIVNTDVKIINGITYILIDFEDSDRGRWFSYGTFSGNYSVSLNVNPSSGNNPISSDEYKKAEKMLQSSTVRPYEPSTLDEKDGRESNENVFQKYLIKILKILFPF